jgi:hypothetical protein
MSLPDALAKLKATTAPAPTGARLSVDEAKQHMRRESDPFRGLELLCNIL